MKINLTKKQYKQILRNNEIASYLLGPMGDFVSEDYKKESKEIEELESYLVQYAKDFDCDDIVDKIDDELFVSGSFSEDILENIISEYDDYSLFNNLSSKLAWRDFRNKYTEEEIEKMLREHGGYAGVVLYDFEKKYYDEFENGNYDKLFIPDFFDKKLNDWNVIKSDLREKDKKVVFVDERDVRWCFLGENVGYETNGTGKEFSRPVVVLKKVSLNTSLVIPLTKSNKRKNSVPLGNIIDEKDSFALLEQIRLVDNKRFKNKVCVLEKNVFAKLINATKYMFEGV